MQISLGNPRALFLRCGLGATMITVPIANHDDDQHGFDLVISLETSPFSCPYGHNKGEQMAESPFQRRTSMDAAVFAAATQLARAMTIKNS